MSTKGTTLESNRRTLRYEVFLEEDVFVARCLDIEVASDGETADPATANLREALTVYFDDPEFSFLLELGQADSSERRQPYSR